MSNLEPKAKSSYQIAQSLKGQQNGYLVISGSVKTGDAICESDEEHAKRVMALEDRKWVPFVDTQKEIELREKIIEALNSQVLEERAKIEAANKILGEIGISDLIDERFLAGKIQRLRNVLLFPRKEPQETTT
jgi:hypothetical protein